MSLIVILFKVRICKNNVGVQIAPLKNKKEKGCYDNNERVLIAQLFQESAQVTHRPTDAWWARTSPPWCYGPLLVPSNNSLSKHPIIYLYYNVVLATCTTQNTEPNQYCNFGTPFDIFSHLVKSSSNTNIENEK